MKLLFVVLFAFATPLLMAQTQYELLKSFSGKELYTIKDKTDKYEIEKDPFTIELTKDAVGNVTAIQITRPEIVKRQTILSREFKANYSAEKVNEGFEIVPRYITKYGHESLTFFDGIFYEYSCKFIKESYSKGGYSSNIGFKDLNIRQVFSDDKAKLQAYSKNPDAAKSKLEEYLNKVVNSVEEAKAQKAAEEKKKIEDQQRAFKEEQERKSIKGKDIVKIEVVWLTKESETSLGTTIKFGVKATDKNGVEYKTSELESAGLERRYDYEFSTDCDCKVDFFGLTVPLPVNTIKNDQITLTVRSKHHPNLKPTIASIKLSYSQPINLYFNGPRETSTSNRNGHHGESLKLYVAQSANKKYYLLDVKDNFGNSKGRLKMLKGVSLNIFSNGSNGRDALRSFSAGSGGNGGNIIIYHTPGLPVDFINITNEGGFGGKGGRNGLPGKVERIAQAVNLDF